MKRNSDLEAENERLRDELDEIKKQFEKMERR